MLKEGKGPASKTAGAAAAAIGGVGLARAAGVAGLEVEEAAEDERYLRKVHIYVSPKSPLLTHTPMYICTMHSFRWNRVMHGHTVRVSRS